MHFRPTVWQRHCSTASSSSSSSVTTRFVAIWLFWLMLLSMQQHLLQNGNGGACSAATIIALHATNERFINASAKILQSHQHPLPLAPRTWSPPQQRQLPTGHEHNKELLKSISAGIAADSSGSTVAGAPRRGFKRTNSILEAAVTLPRQVVGDLVTDGPAMQSTTTQSKYADRKELRKKRKRLSPQQQQQELEARERAYGQAQAQSQAESQAKARAQSQLLKRQQEMSAVATTEVDSKRSDEQRLERERDVYNRENSKNSNKQNSNPNNNKNNSKSITKSHAPPSPSPSPSNINRSHSHFTTKAITNENSQFRGTKSLNGNKTTTTKKETAATATTTTTNGMRAITTKIAAAMKSKKRKNETIKSSNINEAMVDMMMMMMGENTAMEAEETEAKEVEADETEAATAETATAVSVAAATMGDFMANGLVADAVADIGQQHQQPTGGNKQILLKNLKQSKNVINSEHLLYDFKANLAKLIANDGEDGETAEAAEAEVAQNEHYNKNNMRNNNSNSNNSNAEINLEHDNMQTLHEMERVSNGSSNNANYKNNNSNKNKNNNNNTQSDTEMTKNNTSKNKQHADSNYNIDNLNKVEHTMTTSIEADGSEAASEGEGEEQSMTSGTQHTGAPIALDAAVAAAASDVDVDFLQLEAAAAAVQSISKNISNNNSNSYQNNNTNNNKNILYNKINKLFNKNNDNNINSNNVNMNNMNVHVNASHSKLNTLKSNSNNNNNNNNKNNNKNRAPHSNERRHIVPEKLQYTKEIVIKQGKLMGITRHFHTSTGLRAVDQYLGLPYAEAPVGSRRFMPPGAPLPWSGLKIARHLPPVCPQQLPDLTAQAATGAGGSVGSGGGAAKMSRGRYKQLTRLLPYLKTESEDCLYLNVYVPRGDTPSSSPSFAAASSSSSYTYDMDTTATTTAAKLLPVMVYVHGESFEWNSGNPYDGSVLASYGQVIVVTINYRLGVMGFLKPSIADNTVANFGLLDQIAALHWIKENIVSFGGDKDSVTLMGHSTGAACVNYLMISPVASGLFHRAILMSGSAMSDWAASNHSLQLTMQIAHTLNCPLSDDNEEMLSCLRQKRYQDILKIPTAFPQFSTSLGPIVDGHVIPNQPYKVMGQYTEHFSRYDLLFGITESEAYHTLNAQVLDEGLRENERDNLLRFYMQTRFDVRPDLALAATIKKYEDMYINPAKGTNLEHRDVVLDILSDARVVGPLMQTGLFHADVNRRNYMYVFGHNSAAGPYASLPHSIAGEELAFVFGAPLAPAGPFPSNSYGVQEKLLAEAVMTYWTNFAKTGNPKAPWKGNFINSHAMEWDRYDIDWPEFNKRTQVYMNIGIPPSIGYKYRQIYMNFWNKELPDELNQIANIQRQPYLHTIGYGDRAGGGGGGANDDNENADSGIVAQYPRGSTAATHITHYPPAATQRRGNSEVITGHMSQFGTRDNGAEDPVRTLKLLLQEPWKFAGGNGGGNSAEENGMNGLRGGSDGVGGFGGVNGGGVAGMETTFAENMYNSPPTFGVNKNVNEDDETHRLLSAISGMANGANGGTNAFAGGFGGGLSTVGTGTALAGGNAIYGVPRLDMTEDNYGGGGGAGGGGSGGGGRGVADQAAVGGGGNDSHKEDDVAKSETTLQLLIGLIAIFIVLNIVIYSTFLIKKRKKAQAMKRKLGGILGHYDAAAVAASSVDADDFKRLKQNGDGDESYVLDIVRKSNTYEAVKTERSPINGYQMTRQLSTSTVDTHTKVCAWMSAAAAGAAAEAKACMLGSGADSSKCGSTSKKSSSPTFSSLRSSSAGGSFRQQAGGGVAAPQKVSVAVDATPQARSGSVLAQEPIEVLKLKADGRNIIICQEVEVLDQELLLPQNSLDSSRYTLMRQHSAATEPCDAELPQEGQLPNSLQQLQPQHAHSHSDPVDMQHYYSSLCDNENEKVTSFLVADVDVDINVTSRDDAELAAAARTIQLTPAQQLQLIKRRNYPKVLPTNKSCAAAATKAELGFIQSGDDSDDSPPMTLDLRTTNKRNSLPPNSFLPHFGGGGGAGGSSTFAGARYPPLPPPRTISTLGRKPSQRRNSNNITTSPLKLAHDFTAEEEEDINRPITQNTLIVGPIVPQQKPKAAALGASSGSIDANYATLKRANELSAAGTTAKVTFNSVTGTRAILDEAVEGEKEGENEKAAGETAATNSTKTTTTTALHNIAAPAAPPSSNADCFVTRKAAPIGVTTFLRGGGAGGAGLQSFESQPVALLGLNDQLIQQQKQKHQMHHTERVYAVQVPSNLPTSPTTKTTANSITPTLMSGAPMVEQQNQSLHNNIPISGGGSIADIYAQPNKSAAIKAKLSVTAEQTKIATPTNTEATIATTTNNKTSVLPTDFTTKTTATGAITATEVTKLNHTMATIEAIATTTKETPHTCTANRLGAMELTANSGDNSDKQVTANGGQTMEKSTGATTTATSDAMGACMSSHHKPQMQLRNASGAGSDSDSLQAQLQLQQKQQQQPTKPTQQRHMLPTTASLKRNASIGGGTIANAIAAQLAQTKPLKAALAEVSGRGGGGGGGGAAGGVVCSAAPTAQSKSTTFDCNGNGNDSDSNSNSNNNIDDSHSRRMTNVHDSCSTGTKGGRNSSASTAATPHCSARTSSDSSCSSASSSSSSSTGTVRTELPQRSNNSNNNNSVRPTQI